ncbi:MAG TPA: PAS domain S-box protein [Polyangiales bacterium]
MHWEIPFWLAVPLMGTCVWLGFYLGRHANGRARKHARLELDLQRAKDRLELGLRSSQASIFEFDLVAGGALSRSTLINFWEPLGYELPGASASLQDQLAQVLSPDDLQRLMQQAAACLRDSLPSFQIDFQVRHRDGAWLWRLARGVALRSDAGELRGFIGSVVDITDLKRAERALRASETRFRSTFENASVGMALADMDGTTFEGNDALSQFLGYERNELVGLNVRKITVPDESETDAQNRARLQQGRVASFTRDKRYLRKDGSAVWGNVSASAIEWDGAGRPTLLLALVQDISERKRLEQDLARAKELLELAIRSSDVAIFELELADGKLEGCSQTYFNFYEALGYDVPHVTPSYAELMDRVLPDWERERVPRLIQSYLDGALPTFELEHQLRHRDGSLHWKIARGVVLRDQDGRARRFIGTSIDITELKRVSADLQQAREAAETANRAKDEFLANVSHEIRTPMNAILGMTELVLDSTHTKQQRRLLSMVKSAASNLLSIIDDLLDFSKIAAGKLALDPIDFSLRLILDETVGALSVRAQRKGLALYYEVQPDVPDRLRGDAGRLRQILMNLVGNAIKFTVQGRVDVEVSGEESTDEVGLSVVVRDTGIGIPRDKQADIFRAFEQADSSSTRKYGGTGLGLTISAQLAALMGGDIRVESELGIGSTFTFGARFKRARRELPEPSVLRSSPRPPPRAARGLQVLVAEDNELNVVLLEHLLMQAGHQAEFASDGGRTLALLSEGNFDLLLLDLHMPEIDGFEVVRRIRAREQGRGTHLPIVAVSARSSESDRQRCFEAGIDDFVAKPVEAAALWAAIERVVARLAPRGLSSWLSPHAILGACDGHEALLAKMCSAFRRTVPVQLQRVEQAVASDDLVTASQAAHMLRGTLSAFSKLAEDLTRSLEDAAQAGDGAGCRGWLERLQPVVSELIDATHELTVPSLRSAAS